MGRWILESRQVGQWSPVRRGGGTVSGSNFTHDQLTEIIVTDRMIIERWSDTTNHIRTEPPKPKTTPSAWPVTARHATERQAENSYTQTEEVEMYGREMEKRLDELIDEKQSIDPKSILPCPFCGTKVQIRIDMCDDFDPLFIECDISDSGCGVVMRESHASELFEKWNRRGGQ